MDRRYAVRTKPRQEAQALDHLERQAFTTYLPLIKTPRRRLGKWQSSVEPLFPGYLFVCIDPSAQSTAPIRSTRGVLGLVRFGNELRPVPHGVVERLAASQAERDTPIDPAALFRPGTEVMIADGALAGVRAIFEARSSDDRVYLLFELLGKTNRIEVPAHQVVPAA